MPPDDDDHPADHHDDQSSDEHHPGVDANHQVVVGAGEPGDTTPTGRARSEATVLRTVQSLGAVIGPSALITGLLFYFGYVKAAAFSSYFGLDVSLFGLSTRDFVLQSIRPVFVPLGLVLIAGLLLLWAHGALVRQVELRPRRPLWSRLAGGLAVAGAASCLLGLRAYADPFPSDLALVLTPLSLMLGVGLLSYAGLVERHRRHPRDDNAPPVRLGPTGGPGLSVILVSLLLAVGLVWVVANYADVKGRQEARFIDDQLAFLPGVVVYSAKGLHIAAPGVQETRFPEPESAFGFRYDGLKLLFHSGGTYFLVPESWSTSNGTTVVLRQDDSLRLEFVRPPD